MTDLLFDTPWWLPAAIAVVGIAVFTSANKRRQVGTRNVGLGIILLAVLLPAVSYFVDTDKEKVVARTNALIRAVDDRDWRTFRSLLDADTSFLNYSGPDELTEGATLSVEKFNLRDVAILSREVRDDQTLITVTVDALSEQDLPPYPLRSTWEFDWQQRGDEWLLYEIRPVTIGEQQVGAEETVRRELPTLPPRNK